MPEIKRESKNFELSFQNTIFQISRYNKEVLLNVVVYLLIVSKHHQVSQKPQKNEMVVHQETIRKLKKLHS